MLLCACLAGPLPEAASADLAALERALDAQDEWLGEEAKRTRWHRFLRDKKLRKQLTLGEKADPAELDLVLQRYESGEAGLQLGPFRRVRTALRNWRNGLRDPALSDPAKLALAVRNEYRPITEEDVTQARLQLAQRAVTLENAVGGASPAGQAWKEYLLWSGVQEQLPLDTKIDLLKLRTTYDRLSSGEEGLERPEFQQTAKAIKRVMDLALISRAQDQQAYYARQLQLLSQALDRSRDGRNVRAVHQIQQRLALIEGLGQSPELVGSIRSQYGQPNLLVSASESLLDRWVRRPVSDTRPVRNNILGTSIVGTGTTAGYITLDLMPSTHAARLDFQLTGCIDTDTYGVNGPVRIRTDGDTSVSGRKTVELTNESFRVIPASVNATTQSRTLAIQKLGPQVFTRLVRKVARKRIAESRGQANAIASRTAEKQVAGEFDQEVADEVFRFRRQYDKSFSKPLRRRHAEPQSLQLSTTSDSLDATIVQARTNQLAASTPAPPVMPGDVSLLLHQTSLANLATAFLGGATISQQTKDKRPTIDAVLPPALEKAIAERSVKRKAEPSKADDGKQAASFKPWELNLRREQPVSFVFKEGKIEVLVHATRIKSGDELYRSWDLVLTFQPELEAGQWYLQLVGDIDVLPTSFDPEVKGNRIATRQRAYRRNLATQINKRLEENDELSRRPRLGPFDLTSQAKAGLNELVVEQVASGGGWLSVSLIAR